MLFGKGRLSDGEFLALKLRYLGGKYAMNLGGCEQLWGLVVGKVIKGGGGGRRVLVRMGQVYICLFDYMLLMLNYNGRCLNE